MAVKSVTVSKPVIALSKDGYVREIYLLTDRAILLRRFNTRRKSNADYKFRTRMGLAASKVSSGNKPQYATAGGNITQINYYGSDYSQAHAGTQQVMDPERFTKPIAELAGTALKSPTVEELGYSDRIMQITAGNSTITTQEAAQAVVAYGQWPEVDEGVGEAIDKQTKPGPAVDRFYTLDSFLWTNTWKGTGVNLPGALTDMGMFGQNCAYHFLMKSGFCVHVQCNASKFHQGMFMVVAIPECKLDHARSTGIYLLGDDDFRNYPKAQLTIFPHQLVNLRTNNSATLVLPYMNSNPSENALSHSYWTVWVLPIVPLSYQSGATTAVPITMSISPMASSFAGLRNKVSIPEQQGVPVFDVPGSGQFITTIRNSGFPVFPDYEESPMANIPGKVNNLLEVMQVDTFCTPDMDNMHLTIDVTSPDALATRIASWDMSLNANLLSSTYLARCTRWFSNYRGSLNLTLMFCGSAMATGKFLVAYTPPGGQAPTTRTEAMLGTHTVWDVGLQSSINFVIPWISQTAYRFGHMPGSVLSYRGYITLFYQTHVVVPPGAPGTCQIVVLASAAKDFVCRCPTDSAYYQGIGDELGKVISGHISTAMSNVDLKPVEGANIGDGLNIVTGDAAALTAPETGASSTTEAASVMETRELSNTFSARETDINNFMSKYAAFSHGRLNAQSSQGGFIKIPLYFSDTATTQRAVRAKYRMFTYLRMGFDVVIVLSVGPGTVSNNDKALPIADPVVQAIYCPPGCPTPTTTTSPEWFLPTTPSVYQKVNSPNICIRIPYMGLGTAYTSVYNGYANFNPIEDGYGKDPGNYIGDICLRYVTENIENAITSQIKIEYVAYARPTNISVWGPRPIVPLREEVYLAASRGRIEFAETGSGRLVQGNDGVERRHFGKRSQMKRRPRAVYSPSVPSYAKEALSQMYLAHDRINGTSFHIMPISTTQCVFPLHLYSPKLDISKNIYTISVQVNHKIEWESKDTDLICLSFEWPIFHGPAKVCTSTTHHAAWCIIQTMEFQEARFMGELENIDHIIITQENGTKKEQHCILEAYGNNVLPGFCGSPVVCPHGICGLTTAGTDEDNPNKMSDFVHLMMVPEFQAEVQGPEEQGLREWCTGAVKEMGAAFGEGAMTEVVGEAMKALSGKDLKSDVLKGLVQLLVKTICAMVLISKADDKFATAATVGILIGVDLLTVDPFEWLKSKVTGAVQEQGPIEWIKDFNAACTAAKGLEWIGQRISTFIDWVKSYFEKENPRRTKFIEALKDLPILMEYIDKIQVARGKYPDETVKKVCNAMRDLKRGADVYGVERNAATSQIVKYYGKAMAILQSMTKGRTEPVAMLIHGAPGTGKSLATEIVGRHLTEACGGHRPYSLPPDPKHFDGYAQQPVVIMDDLGQNPDGEDCKLLCQMVSSTEFIVPMAALEEKGMSFTSQFVLASTNVGQLRPPTVAEPKAIQRRFFIDAAIVLDKNYEKNGKLDADSALSACSHPSVNFKRCCPLICGKAATFKCLRTNISYSLDDLTTKMKREHIARKSCGSKLEALFQGPDDWLESDMERAPPVLKTIEELSKEGIKEPMPALVADLLAAVPTPEVVEYCERKNWIIPQKVQIYRTKASIKAWVNHLATGLTILSCVASLGGFLYMMYKIFASSQGPYTSLPTSTLRAPEKRIAKVQGPDMEFVHKMMNQNLFDVVTQRGSFTGLGLYSTWLLLPKHSEPGETVVLEGNDYNVVDCVQIENNHGSLELIAIKLDRPTNFRDVRKFFPEHFTKEKDCLLVMNNKTNRRMWCPVGSVSMFGFLNLSNKPTYNTCQYRYPTKSGQCGGVVVKAGKIIAMHIGGDGANGYGAILTRSIVSLAAEQGEMVNFKKSIGKPINLSSKTKLHPSVFHSVFPGKKEPAALHPKDKRLEVNFDDVIFQKYKGNKGFSITENMVTAMEHYADQIRPLLPENVTEPLSLEDVVYGTENLEGLDLNTSAGYPYVIQGVKKKDLIPERGQPLTKLTEALALNGYDLPFVTYLKDELRPIDKVKKGKTRLIECSSLNDTIRMKIVFGRLFQVFHQNPGIATGSAVGCNPDVDWSRFYAEMGGQPLTAFDYSNFDASMDPAWFDLLKMFLKRIGYSDDDVKLIDHIKCSRHLYKDKQYDVVGGMPSGCSGTSIFNSINNNHILRTLVLDVYKGINMDHLKIIAYGDDVVMTYPFQLDAAALAEQGAKYGLTMTPPDKEAEFNETTWDNVTFLKRSFKPDHEFPFLIHPVYKMEEVYESIRWCRSAAQTQEHVYSLCLLAWHNGEEVYEDFLKAIRTTSVGRNLHLPSYRVLRHNWLELF